MLASKLISFSKTAIFMLSMAASSQAISAYYIEYMHDPCVEYDACYGAPVKQLKSHYRHHRHYSHRRQRSQATIQVYYSWNIYPIYGCDTCEARPIQRCDQGCTTPYTRAPVEYHDNDYKGDYKSDYKNDYNRSYYSAYSDQGIDYDTSTADDVGPSYRW